MGEYSTYYFKAPLNGTFVGDAEAFREYAVANDVYFDLASTPGTLSSDTPSFGADTTYEGPSFDHWGLEIADGHLMLGVEGKNLERQDEPEEDEEGIKGPSTGTRLERILRLLSSVTDGEIGEVQGAYSGERWDYDTHADPIVRCGDGQLRVAKTPVTSHDDGGWVPREEPAKTPIPALLPDDLVSTGYDGARLELDVPALIGRYSPVDVRATPALR